MNARRLALVGALALLVLPAVLPGVIAQFGIPAGHATEVSGERGPEQGTVMLSARLNGVPDRFGGSEFLIVDADTFLNVTIRNGLDRWVNDTLVPKNMTTNVAVGLPDPVAVSVPPKGVEHVLMPVRVSETGAVGVEFELQDTDHEGRPVTTHWSGPVLPAVSVDVVSPLPPPEDDEFERIVESWRRFDETAAQPVVRLSTQQQVEMRVRVTNLRDVTVPGFTLNLQPTHGSWEHDGIDVPPLEPGESRDVTFPAWGPADSFGADARFHSGQDLAFIVRAEHAFGENRPIVTAGAFRIENGAVQEVAPTVFHFQAVSEVTADYYVTRDLQLGEPARIRVNVTNHGLVPAEDVRVTVDLMTPGRADYGVQGPERWVFDLGRLEPGATASRTMTWTPRVTGDWDLSTFTRWGGRGTGSSGSMISVPQTAVAHITDSALTGNARMGERVDFHLVALSTTRIDNAELRIASSSGYRSYSEAVVEETGPRFPGLVNTVLTMDPEVVHLGTLRPGEPVNATVSVVASGSGRYTLIPFILADGFAYTGYGAFADWAPPGSSIENLNVVARTLPAGLALAPFTVLLGAVVGAWTFRTRFVK